MTDLQILTNEAPEWYHTYNKNYNVILVDNWNNVSTNIPIVCSGDLSQENVRYWLTNKQPCVYVARGYLGNHLHKHRKWFRFSVNGWANTKLMHIPYSRWPMLELPKHPWKVKQVKKVLIAPSKLTSKWWTPDLKDQWADSMVDKFPGAEVRIRKKPPRQWMRYNTLWEDFEWADLVVSQSSAITVEAFWYGKKVISLEPCPTWAAKKTTLEEWQDPSEPELRDRWHEHLAWCQYSVEEINTGLHLDYLQQYLGNIVNYNPAHTYNL
jgi:hypothetical protein